MTPEMAATSKTAHKQIIDLVSGNSVRIPDLQAMMAHWPVATNPNLEPLERATRARFERLFPESRSHKRLEKMQNISAALFAAMWWPYAPIEALFTVAWLSIWLFVWDDETDSAEFADLVQDFDRASDFRYDTLQFIRESLCLYQGPNAHVHRSTSNAPASLESASCIIRNFEDVGRAVSQFGNGRLTERFYQELEVFVKMTELEQKVHLSGELPTVREYLDRRMGSSGVHVCLALTE